MYTVWSETAEEVLGTHQELSNALKDAIEWAAHDDIVVSIYRNNKVVFMVDGALVADQLEMMINNEVDTELN